MAKTLIEFSGGLSSTYVLHDVLANTDDEVVCIHFDHSYHSDRWQRTVNAPLRPELHLYQTERCRKIIKWCNDNIRSVTMITRTAAGLNETETILEYRARTCAKYANDNGFNRVVNGLNSRRVDIPWRLTDMTNASQSIMPSVNAAFSSQIDAGNSIAYEYHIVDNNVNVVQKINALPSALYDIVAKCVNPVRAANGHYSICKTCDKEAWVAFAVNAVDSGLTTADNFPTWFVSDLDDNPNVTFPFYNDGTPVNVTVRKFDLINNQVRREIDLSSSTFSISANSAGYLASVSPSSNSYQRWNDVSGTEFVSKYIKVLDDYVA